MIKSQEILSTTLQSVILVVCSYLCGFYFTMLFHEPTSYVGGLWAAISGIIVIDSTASATLHSARIRIVGSLTGAIVSGFYLYFFNFSIYGYGICIASGVALCYLLRVQNAIKLTGITISVILIVSTVEKELVPVVNAGLRFAESAIGTGIALAVAFTAFYLSKLKSKKA